MTKMATWPHLTGNDPALISRAQAERERCSRIILEREPPARLDSSVVEAVRRRTRELLEKETEAEYWITGNWRQDVFGWSTALWQEVPWMPENCVSLTLQIQAPKAQLFGLGAWAEGQEVTEWIETCAVLWILELGRAADEFRRRPNAEKLPAVEGLYRLADQLRGQGDFRSAGAITAFGLLLGMGAKAEPLFAEIERVTEGIVAERLLQHLDPDPS
jgi:hypothetical protein